MKYSPETKTMRDKGLATLSISALHAEMPPQTDNLLLDTAATKQKSKPIGPLRTSAMGMEYRRSEIRSDPNAVLEYRNEHHSSSHLDRSFEKADILIQNLPEELLLEILTYLDDCSLYLVRQTCRLFLRLSYDAKFREYYKDNTDAAWLSPPSYPYPYWRMDFVWRMPIAQYQHFYRLLRKDTYCGRCCQTHENGHFSKAKEWLRSQLFCSGCEVFHPRFLFTVDQRTKASSNRVCIGRQGYIRACPHRSIFWSDIEEFQSELFPGVSDNQLEINCEECANPKDKGLNKGILTGASIIFEKIEGHLFLTVRQEIPVFCSGPTQITYSELKRLCHNSPNRGVFESVSCPRIGPLDGCLIMCAFDAHQCACISSSWAERFGCENHPLLCLCCQCQMMTRPQVAGNFLPSRHRLHQSSCLSHCNASYSWDRDEATGVVTVSIEKRVYVLESPYSPYWIAHLDPHSYSITADSEGKHVTWCPDKNCGTRYRWNGMDRALRRFL